MSPIAMPGDTIMIAAGLGARLFRDRAGNKTGFSRGNKTSLARPATGADQFP
jgi:hypothetical protein